LRQAVACFVERDIKPHVGQCEEGCEFSRYLFRRAAEIGILGVIYPEEWSGFECALFHEVVVTEELTRSGSGGIAAGLMSHAIALPLSWPPAPRNRKGAF
jgi:acyl-CoA dehydrogenase